jgi:hypothetical protein
MAVKKEDIILGLVVFATVTTAGLVIYFSLRNKDDKKYNSNTKNKNNDGKIKSILFIGDSNTVANYSYADQLKKIYPNLKIKKIAKVGEKTDWMKNQLSNELNNNKYDLIGILGGSNDIYSLGKNDSAKKNLNDMYNLIHSKGSKVLAVTPPNKDFYVNKTEQKQKSLFDLVDWMRNNNKIDYLVDFHKITGDKKYFSANDGYLHANSSAHKILTDNVKQKINVA